MGGGINRVVAHPSMSRVRLVTSVGSPRDENIQEQNPHYTNANNKKRGTTKLWITCCCFKLVKHSLNSSLNSYKLLLVKFAWLGQIDQAIRLC